MRALSPIIIKCERLHEILVTIFLVDVVKLGEKSPCADDQSERSGGVHDEDVYLPL